MQFPEKSCYKCEHAYFGSKGIWCEEWNEIVLNDITAARDCACYDPT